MHTYIHIYMEVCAGKRHRKLVECFGNNVSMFSLVFLLSVGELFLFACLLFLRLRACVCFFVLFSVCLVSFNSFFLDSLVFFHVYIFLIFVRLYWLSLVASSILGSRPAFWGLVCAFRFMIYNSVVTIAFDMVRSTLLQHGVQGAPTGKMLGPCTQSVFKGKMARYFSDQKSNESLTGNP